MLPYALRYGAPAGALAIGGILSGLVFNFASSEVFGYTVMLLALSLVYVGLRHYREHELGGQMSWAQGFGLGVLIALVAGLVYVAIWELYLASTGYTFFDRYLEETLATLESSGASEAEIAAQRDEMESFRGLYANPVLRPMITLSEIFPVGLLVSAVSAGLLRRTSAPST